MKNAGIKNHGMKTNGMKNTRWSVLLTLLAFLLIGCEQKGPAERAGERIDEVAEDISDSAKNAGNKIEDACEELKEGAGAEDTDC